MRACLTLLLISLSFPAIAANPGPPAASPARSDATTRLSTLRKLAVAKGSRGGMLTTKVNTIASSAYKAPTFSMTIPDNLGRAPTISDVTIGKGLDGRTPAQALAQVRSKMTTPVASQNSALVDNTILGTHKAFTVAVNNAFTSGSPANKMLSGPWAGSQVSVLGVMSQVHPTVIMAKAPTDKVARYYVPNASGSYDELPTLPYAVIMKARLQDGAKGGVRLNYMTWGNKALGGPLSTVTELGSGGAPQ